MFFEKQVRSFVRLMEEVALLDLDSGIRTFGDYREGRKRDFVFVTRSPHESYVLMVYERRDGKAPRVGDRLFVKEFRRRSELGAFMEGLLSRPVRAFVY